MGIQEIEKDVMDASKKEADRAIRDAEKSAQDILRKARQEAESKSEAMRLQSKKQLEREEKREMEAARFEKTTMVLRAKKQLFDEAIADAFAALEKIPAKKRKDHLKALLQKASKEIKVASVLVNKKDIPYIEGIKAHEAKIAGGLIAIDASETLRVDLSYDTLFSEIVESERKEISSALFGENR